MRIISGTHKSRNIVAPKSLPVRPTTDFAKESLFNILGNYFDFDTITVLDLFSGTGNITYEFASRGCKKITSIDENFNCCSFIKKTITSLDFQNVTVIKSDVFSFLKYCKDPFDLIFADPPYEHKQIETIPNLVFEKKLLNKEGWLILEHSASNDFTNHSCFFEQRNYGKVNFSIFR